MESDEHVQPGTLVNTWLIEYFAVLKRSIPSMTYVGQRSARLPAICLHSMIACGSCSSCSSRMSVNAIGMSVIPVVRRALGVECLRG